VPSPNGQNYLADYVAELQALGFDAFQPAELETYVNRGYMYVARKSRWYWETTTDTLTLAPGAYNAQLWPLGTELPYFKSLDRVYITTYNFAGKLEPMSDEEFARNWLNIDLSQPAVRGTPSRYKVWNQFLYILSPPQTSLDFIIHYHRRIAPMTHAVPGVSDLPITPPHLDEAILLAAKLRCHTRAQELTLANQASAELADVFDDMRDDDAEVEHEVQERAHPDDQWL